MAADSPHTLYKGIRDKGKVTQSDVDEAVRLTKEAAERKRRQRAGPEGYTIDEIFSGKADIEQEENEE